MDCRGQMMRRDINGKVDGDGIKAGDAITTGASIVAPLVIGKVSISESPQSLKTLGGIPEVEVTATVSTIGKQGKIIETTDKFSPKEKQLADFLAKEGKTVEKLPENHALPGRKGDALVDGVKTEFKKPDVGATNGTIKNEISSSIRREGQARNIVIDARNSGLTESEAQRGLARASGITRGKIDSVRIIGNGFDITATNFK